MDQYLVLFKLGGAASVLEKKGNFILLTVPHQEPHGADLGMAQEDGKEKKFLLHRNVVPHIRYWISPSVIVSNYFESSWLLFYYTYLDICLRTLCYFGLVKVKGFGVWFF